MLFTRKIGAILRGKATPFQLAAGCTLGALLGFVPGFSAAPGLFLFWALLLVLLNANLFLAAVVGGASKLLSLVALPLTFQVGRILLEGPTESLFRAMVNAPGLALMGFENYAATGGLVMGALVGAIVSWLVVRGVSRFRQRMADASANSERYKKWNSRGWVRWSVFLLAGGGLKDPDYAALASKKVGNPIRPLGAALVIVTVVFVGVALKFFAPQIITTALRDGLEKANGATVDLESADLDLGAGRLEIVGLAMTDPNNLGSNLFAAQRIEADVSGADLLRKRLTLDNVVVSEARLSEDRRVPGRKVATAPEAESGFGIPLPDTGSIDDYLRNAKVWKERLAQLKSWLDRMSPAEPDAAGGEIGAEEGDASWTERIERIARERGYAAVTADQLIDGAPTLLVRALTADGVRAKWLPEETLAVRATNLSTQPWLVEAPATVSVTSSGDTAAARIEAGRISRLDMHYRGVPAADVAAALQSSENGTPLLQGGTVDVAFDGTYNSVDGTIDFPLDVTLHDTTANIAGKAVPLNNFTLPVGLAGSLGNPRIKVDQNQLGRIAQQAGTQLLKDKASEAIGDKAGGLFKGLLGGGKKTEEKPPETPDNGGN